MLKLIIGSVIIMYSYNKLKWYSDRKKFLQMLDIFDILVDTSRNHKDLDSLEETVEQLILINKTRRFM